MKNILITRPKENARELIDYMLKQQINAICEPIFSVKKLKFSTEKNFFVALIITSVNACFALENQGFDKNIKIFTIGKKLSQSLLDKGFNNLEIAQNAQDIAQKISILSFGDSKNLGELRNYLENSPQKNVGKILYLRGEKITFDFAKEFNFIDEKIVYKIIAKRSFSAGFLDFCNQNKFDEVLIFSKNSADIFINLAKKHHLLQYFQQSKMVCLSEEIRQHLENQGFTRNEIFAENLIVRKFYV